MYFLSSPYFKGFLLRLALYFCLYMVISFDEEKQKEQLTDLHEREERALVQTLAEKAGILYIDLIPTPIELDALRLVPEAEARAAQVAGFSLNGNKTNIAKFSPEK